MDDVATRAGISHGAVYHYFPDKRSLYLAVIADVASEMVAATVVDPDRPGEERLWDGMKAHLQFAERYPHAYATLMSGGNGSDEEVRALCEEFRWQGLSEIVRALGIDEPSHRLRIALRAWHGFQEGAIIEWLKDPVLPRDQLLTMMAEALRAALKIGGIEVAANSAGLRS